MTINVIGAEKARLWVSNDGSTFHRIPGVQGHARAEGALNSRQVPTWDGNVTKFGDPEVPSIAVSALANPMHPAWQIIMQAAEDGDELSWRIATREQVHFSRDGASDTVAVAAGSGGLNAAGRGVTFAGSAPTFGAETRFAEGMMLEIASEALVFVFTDVGSTPTVQAVRTAPSVGGTILEPGMTQATVTAVTDYSIRTGALYAEYDAAPSFPGEDLPAEGDLISTFTNTPRSALPGPAALKTHT